MQVAPVAAPVQVHDTPMEDDVATEMAPPPPRDEAPPPSAAVQRGDLHPCTAADAEQQQQQQQDIEEEDAVMEEAALPMGAHSDEPTYMLCDGAHQPDAAPAHAPAPASVVIPVPDAVATAMEQVAQVAPPSRVPVLAVPRPPSGGAMPPPAASPRRVNSGATLPALPLTRDTAERLSAGGGQEHAAMSTMRASAPSAPAPVSPAVAAAAAPRAPPQALPPSQALQPAQAAEDILLAVTPNASQVALTATAPQQQYDSGAVGEALTTSMQVLQSLDQVSFLRVCYRVRSQQMLTLMLSSPPPRRRRWQPVCMMRSAASRCGRRW